MKHLQTGIYRPGYSSVHGLNAAVKLACLALLTIAAAATDSAPGFLAILTVTAAVIYLAELRFSEALAPIKQLAGLLILILIMNTCFGSTVNPWLRWWIFTPSLRGLIKGAVISARVVLIFIFGNVIATTTAPLKLTDALERLFAPLQTLHIPSGRIALIVTASIQFIPLLLEETESIKMAQTARGARFDSRRYFDRAGALAPLIVPVFVAAFRRAEQLSLALESRGYRPDMPGVRKKHEKLTNGDWAALTVCTALCALELIVL